MQRIIVATDGSSGANRAVDAAATLAKTSSADLVILTIGGNITGAELRGAGRRLRRSQQNNGGGGEQRSRSSSKVARFASAFVP